MRALPEALGAARDAGLDPGWPPVLVALVLGVLAAGVISVVVVFRALREEAGGPRARRSGRDRRRRGGRRAARHATKETIG